MTRAHQDAVVPGLPRLGLLPHEDLRSDGPGVGRLGHEDLPVREGAGGSWAGGLQNVLFLRLLGLEEEFFRLEVTAARSKSGRTGSGRAHLLHGDRSLDLREVTRFDHFFKELVSHAEPLGSWLSLMMFGWSMSITRMFSATVLWQ